MTVVGIAVTSSSGASTGTSAATAASGLASALLGGTSPVDIAACITDVWVGKKI